MPRYAKPNATIKGKTKMTNYEFYKDQTTECMMQEFAKSKCRSLNKFLDAEHIWSPKYKVGDIVQTETWSDAEVIVKIDYKNDGYVSIGLGYIANTLLPLYCSYHSFTDPKNVTDDAGDLGEDGIANKIGELVVSKEFFNEIDKHIAV